MQEFCRTDDHLVGGGSSFDDVAGASVRGRAGQSQPSTLTDGEAEVSGVRTQNFAVGGDEGPLARAEAAGEKSASVAIGDEADVVGVGFGGHRQAAALGLGAHSRFGGGIAEGEESAG